MPFSKFVSWQQLRTYDTHTPTVTLIHFVGNFSSTFKANCRLFFCDFCDVCDWDFWQISFSYFELLYCIFAVKKIPKIIYKHFGHSGQSHQSLRVGLIHTLHSPTWYSPWKKETQYINTDLQFPLAIDPVIYQPLTTSPPRGPLTDIYFTVFVAQRADIETVTCCHGRQQPNLLKCR